MDTKEFSLIIESTFSSIRHLSDTKGKEYTDNSGDRLENFKGEGNNLGVSPFIIWSVYASKHWRSIQSYIRHNGKVFSTEPIEDRIDDCILYLILLKGLIADNTHKEVTEKTKTFGG